VRLLRLSAAGLLWVLACLLGLVGSLLCVTVILIPVGVLLISLARRLFRLSGRLALPRAVRHPISELGDTGTRAGRKAGRRAANAVGDVKLSGKSLKRARKAATKKLPGRRRKVLGLF
jgi:hypothetical protein